MFICSLLMFHLRVVIVVCVFFSCPFFIFFLVFSGGDLGAQRFHLPCREHPGRDECPIGCNRSPRLNEGDKQPNRQFVSFFVATFRLQMYGYLCIYEVNV